MDWYDRAEVYDVLFSWDPAEERDFLLGASGKYGIGRPRRILEPFCGTGRLLRTMPGFAAGFDKNARMVRYARGRGCRVFRADAARFAARAGSFDLAYCFIDSFRHLLTEEAARGHLRGVARALVPGGIYVMGLDVTGDLPGDVSGDAWTGERDGMRVGGEVRCLGDVDPVSRVETMRVRLEIRRGRRRERLEVFQPMRVYSRRDVAELARATGFEIAAVFDGSYDLARPVPLSAVAGSAVLVLRHRDRIGGSARGGQEGAPPPRGRWSGRARA